MSEVISCRHATSCCLFDINDLIYLNYNKQKYTQPWRIMSSAVCSAMKSLKRTKTTCCCSYAAVMQLTRLFEVNRNSYRKMKTFALHAAAPWWVSVGSCLWWFNSLVNWVIRTGRRGNVDQKYTLIMDQNPATPKIETVIQIMHKKVRHDLLLSSSRLPEVKRFTSFFSLSTFCWNYMIDDWLTTLN